MTTGKRFLKPSTGQYFGFSINDNGETKTYSHEAKNYQTDVLTRLAIEDIEEGASDSRPFYLAVDYFAPHGEFGGPLDGTALRDAVEARADVQRGVFDFKEPLPAPRHEGMFEGEQLPRTPNFDTSTEAAHVVLGFIKKRIPRDRQLEMASNYRAELESLLAVDEGVSKILETLEALDLSSDTVVIFTSDNGFLHGEHSELHGKYFPWREVLEVPLMMRGPGIPANARNDTLVSMLDIVATIVELADAEPLKTLDGESLMPYVRQTERFDDRAIVIEGLGKGREKDQQNPYTGIMTSRYIYAKSLRFDGIETFYDIEADPYQLRDLAFHGEKTAKLNAFRRLSRQIRNCVGTECHVESP